MVRTISMIIASLPLVVGSVSLGDESLDEMIQNGIQLTPETRVPLPPPTFLGPDGEAISPEAALAAFTDIAGANGIKRFVRDSVVAPISLKVKSIDNRDGDRIGHLIDVAFVVHLPIETLRDSDALKGFSTKQAGDTDVNSQSETTADDSAVDPTEDNVARQLTEEELKANEVTLDRQREALGLLQFPLLGKVVLRGVGHARRAIWPGEETSRPIVLTWQLDPRFSHPNPAAGSLANQWRPIERDAVGRKMLGDPRPYAGIGGYIAITSVPDLESASLVQARMVLHEPKDWFSGHNLLRSKLPLIVQDRVRDLRREVQKNQASP